MVSVILGLLVNGALPKPLTALSLLPVTYGVAYASTLGKLNLKTMATELTTKTAVMAMIANVAFSMRSILRKNLSAEFKRRTNLDAVNEHAATTIFSFFLLLPCAAIYEPVPNALAEAKRVLGSSQLGVNVLVCGFCFYLYNEMQNIVLGVLVPFLPLLATLSSEWPSLLLCTSSRKERPSLCRRSSAVPSPSRAASDSQSLTL